MKVKCTNVDNKLNCPCRTRKNKNNCNCGGPNKDANCKNLNDKKWRKINIKNKKRKYEAAHLDNTNDNVEALAQFQNCSNGCDNSVCNKYDGNDDEQEAKLQQTRINDRSVVIDEIINDHPELELHGEEPIKLLDDCLYEHVNQLGALDEDKKFFDSEFLIPFDENKNDLHNITPLSFKINLNDKDVINTKSNGELEQLSDVNIVEQLTSVNNECTENLRIENNDENEVDNRKTILDEIKLEVEDKDEIINNIELGNLQPILDDYDEVTMDIEIVKNEISRADYSEMSFNSIEEAHEFLKSQGLELNNEVWQLTEKTDSFVEHLFSKEENKAANDVTNKTLKKNSSQLSTKAKIDLLANIKVPHGILSNDFKRKISPRFNEMVVVDILTKVQQAISVDGAELFQTCSNDNPSFLAISNEIKPSPENILSEKIKELNILKDPKSNDVPSIIPVLVVYEGSKRTELKSTDPGHTSIINYLKATTDCLEACVLLDNDEQQSLLNFVNEDVFKVKVRKTKKVVPGEPFIFQNCDFFVWHGNKRDAMTREYNIKRILNYPHRQNNNTFSCGMCRSKHTDRTDFVRHLWFHAKAKPFKCEITRGTCMSRHTEQYIRCLTDTPIAIIPKDAKDALQFYRKKYTRLLPYMVLTDKPDFSRQNTSQTFIGSNRQRVLDVWRQVWSSDQMERAGIFRSVLDGIDEPFSMLSNQIKLNKSEKKIKDVFVLLGADFDAHRSSLPVLVVHSVLYSKEYAHILKGMVLDKVNGNILNEIKTITRWTHGYLVFPGLETETSNYVDNQTITFKRINLKNSLQCRLCLKVMNRNCTLFHGRSVNNACVH